MKQRHDFSRSILPLVALIAGTAKMAHAADLERPPEEQPVAISHEALTVCTLGDAKQVTAANGHVILSYDKDRVIGNTEYQQMFAELADKTNITTFDIRSNRRKAYSPGEVLDRLKDFPKLKHLKIADSSEGQSPKMWESIGRIEGLEELTMTIR